MNMPWLARAMGVRSVDYRWAQNVALPNGTNFVLSLTDADWCIPVVCQFSLVTSAVVSNRSPEVFVQDATSLAFIWRASAVQVASATIGYSAGIGIVQSISAALGYAQIPIPPFAFFAPVSIGVRVGGMDVGDTLTVVGLGYIVFRE